MGATTTLLYGVNLLMTPVYDPIPTEEGSVPEVAIVDHRYQIRVLVPCYKESLELVQRTVTAALDAQLPKGCKWYSLYTPLSLWNSVGDQAVLSLSVKALLLEVFMLLFPDNKDRNVLRSANLIDDLLLSTEHCSAIMSSR